MEIYVKNVGNETAYNVNPFFFFQTILPERQISANHRVDIPQGNCDLIAPIFGKGASIIPGQERYFQIRQGAGTLPKITATEPLQLYSTNCVYYSDRDGTRHGTCAVFGFTFPSEKPLDKIWGTPTFFCDGFPKSGKFWETLDRGCSK
jgi:hypothetical protein